MRRKVILHFFVFFLVGAAQRSFGMELMERIGSPYELSVDRFIFGNRFTFRGLEKLGKLRLSIDVIRKFSRAVFDVTLYPWIKPLFNELKVEYKRCSPTFFKLCREDLVEPNKKSLNFWKKLENNIDRFPGDETSLNLGFIKTILNNFEEHHTLFVNVFEKLGSKRRDNEDFLDCLCRVIRSSLERREKKLAVLNRKIFDKEMNLRNLEENFRNNFQDLEIKTVSERQR